MFDESMLSSTNNADATQVDLDLDLLSLQDKAKTQARDPETMEMVEFAYFKLKDHLWYLRERLVLMTLFSARVADRDKKEMASAVLK